MTNITLDGLPAKTGTISDSGIIHYREGGVDKKMTVADFLIKISEEYSLDINTFLGAADKAAARAALGINRRTTVNNSAYTILNTDLVVAQIGTMSTARIFTLPAANTMEPGSKIIVIDESGTVTTTNKITISRASTDTINGATSKEITSAYGFLVLECDGLSKWTLLNKEQATTTNQGIVYLNNPITIANNATTPNTKIDFLAGNAQLNDGSGQVLLSSTLTKILQSSGAWTAGNDANGLFSGAKANNTWYYAFAIQNTTTNAVDAGFDSSSTGANVPSGWKITKLIHCFRTNASGNILSGKYFKDKTFLYDTSILEETATNATVAGNLTLSYVPPTPVHAINLAYANNNAVNAYAYYVAGTSSSNICWETSKLSSGFGRANGVIPTNNAVIYRSYGGDQARTCELYTNGFKLID